MTHVHSKPPLPCLRGDCRPQEWCRWCVYIKGLEEQVKDAMLKASEDHTQYWETRAGASVASYLDERPES